MDVNAEKYGSTILDWALVGVKDSYGLNIISLLIERGANFDNHARYKPAEKATELLSMIKKLKFKEPGALICLNKCRELLSAEIQYLKSKDLGKEDWEKFDLNLKKLEKYWKSIEPSIQKNIQKNTQRSKLVTETVVAINKSCPYEVAELIAGYDGPAFFKPKPTVESKFISAIKRAFVIK